jgi:hypothetical protein
MIMTWFTTFFFMMTTLSLVGYGSDIQSPPGRVSIIFFIALVIAIVPDQCSRLVHLINSKSVYAMKDYKKIDKVPFIVLIGAVVPTSLINFLEEYFHKDHNEDEDYTRHCVLMQPYGPEQIPELHMIVNKYIVNLIYLEGNPTERNDL